MGIPVVNKLCKYLLKFLLQSLKCALRSGISRSYASITFHCLRYHPTVFLRSCTVLHSHQQCRGSSTSTLSPTLVFLGFGSGHPNWCKGYFVVLFCNSLMISNIEHLFMWWPSHLCIFEKIIIHVFCQFLCKRRKRCRFDPWEDPLEEGMATHYSILAWRIPWTEEPCRLQSLWSQRVGHNWNDLAHSHSTQGAQDR